MRCLVVVLLFIAQAAQACALVDGDRISGLDLARADARYASLPPDLFAGFAPVPGARRVLDLRLLSTIAREHGIAVEGLSPLCFERPMQVLTESVLRTAIESVLGGGTRVEIVEFSRYPVPQGALVFALTDLNGPPAASPNSPVTWRGHVKYGTRSTAVVWAKVRVTKWEQWLETSAAIPAHTTIRTDQIVAKSGWRFPFATPALADVDRVVGKQAVRSLNSGTVVVPAMLALPFDVERGGDVDVEVASGGVRLKFSARAETGGHIGEMVVLFRESTGRRYRGRVQEKGKVSIDADGSKKSDVARRQPDLARDGSPGAGRNENEESEAGRAGLAAGPLPR